MSKYSEAKMDYAGFIEDLEQLANERLHWRPQFTEGSTWIREHRTVGFRTVRQSGATHFISEWIRRKGMDQCLVVGREDRIQRVITGLGNFPQPILFLPWSDFQRNVVTIHLDAGDPDPKSTQAAIMDFFRINKTPAPRAEFYVPKGVAFGWNLSVHMPEAVMSGQSPVPVTPPLEVEPKDSYARYKNLTRDAQDKIRYVICEDAASMFGFGGVRRKDFYEWMQRLHGDNVLVIEVN